MALLSDAISHSILLGIVFFALMTKSLTSPLLLIGAGLSGLILVFVIELLSKTRLIAQSVSMGVLYPFFFSIAVILINVFGRNVHLDTHTVLLGEIAFTVFDPWTLGTLSLGPKAFYIGLFLLILNLVFLIAYYKPLMLSTFDPSFALTLGLSPMVFHYLIMGLVSFTTVASFNSIGAILVVAFMIAPPSTAFLLTKRLHTMFLLTFMIALLSCTLGVSVAFLFDTSVSGSIAIVMGVVFIFAALISPNQGVLSLIRRKQLQKQTLLLRTLLTHLTNHQNTPEEAHENTFTNLLEHFKWKSSLAKRILYRAKKQNLIVMQGNLIRVRRLP